MGKLQNPKFETGAIYEFDEFVESRHSRAGGNPG
jgi:hypothetical protein